MPCFCKNYTEPHHKLDFRRGVWYNKVPMKEVTTKYKMFRLRMRCKPPNACGMLRENTVTHHSMRFGTVSECLGAITVPSLNFKAVTQNIILKREQRSRRFLMSMQRLFCFAHFQLNRKFTKLTCPFAEKSQQLNIGRRFFEEIFKKGNIFALLTAYSLRDKKFFEKFS